MVTWIGKPSEIGEYSFAGELSVIIHLESTHGNTQIFHRLRVKYNLAYVTSLFTAVVEHEAELPQKLD